MIPFNKIHLFGIEKEFVLEAIASNKISGNGNFTKKCQTFFEQKYTIKKTFLTHSCSAALEMTAILIGIQPGDEVILPSFTFVSTANAFLLRGAKLIFADSQKNNPNIDANTLELLITPQTKAIVVVHYAGIACDMDKIMALASKYNLIIIEDAAHAIDAYYKGKPLGTIGHLGAFSFHESKNITAGEGGLLCVNDEKFIKRAEIIWEKGTDRAAFLRGEINQYSWNDLGSSFYPSEMVAAFLYGQLLNLENTQQKRKAIWQYYYDSLLPLASKKIILLAEKNDFSASNGHIFYLICSSLKERNLLIDFLKSFEISAVFHFSSLHKSLFFKNQYQGNELTNSDNFSDCLLRLPLFYDLTTAQQDFIVAKISDFYK